MIASIRAEFKKLLTVRSTYLMCALALALITLMNFYFEGYRGVTGSPASMRSDLALQEIIANSAGMTAVFVVIIAILLMAHEYRYNTIMYTLTANTSRTKVLLSKFITASTFGVIFGLLASAYAIGCYMFGLSLSDASLPAQQFDALSQFGKIALYFADYALVGLILAILLRSVVGAIAFFFIVPITVEPLLGIVLKEKAMYLPFTALDRIIHASVIQTADMSSAKAMLVSGIYLVIAGVVAWLVFMRRDAN